MRFKMEKQIFEILYKSVSVTTKLVQPLKLIFPSVSTNIVLKGNKVFSASKAHTKQYPLKKIQFHLQSGNEQ